VNTDDESSFTKRVKDIRKQRERLEAVLRSLPVPPECEQPIKDDLGYLNREMHIRAYAENLSLVAGSDYAVPRGDKASIRALDTLSKHLAKVRETLAALPLEAENALERTGGYSVASQWTLDDFARRVEAAKELLEAKPIKKLAGRPESRQAFEVACEARRAYEWLTNKQAGITTSATERGHPRSGEFLDFLTEIFKVLNIKASPVSQAKKALANRTAPWRPDDYSALVTAMEIEVAKPHKSPGEAASAAMVTSLKARQLASGRHKQKSSRKKSR